MREAMEKKTVAVKKGFTRMEPRCGRCGAQPREGGAGDKPVQVTARQRRRATVECLRLKQSLAWSRAFFH